MNPEIKNLINGLSDSKEDKDPELTHKIIAQKKPDLQRKGFNRAYKRDLAKKKRRPLKCRSIVCNNGDKDTILERRKKRKKKRREKVS